MAQKPLFKPEYCKSLIKHMGKGLSYTTWGVAQDPPINRSTLYLWEKNHPEWKEAKEIGYDKGLLFYESLATAKTMGIMPEELKKLGSRGIDGPSVYFILRTRFHKEYGDNTEAGKALAEEGGINVHFVKTPEIDDSERQKKIAPRSKPDIEV